MRSKKLVRANICRNWYPCSRGTYPG